MANVSTEDLPSCSGEYPMWKSAKINTGTLALLICCPYHSDPADHCRCNSRISPGSLEDL